MGKRNLHFFRVRNLPGIHKDFVCVTFVDYLFVYWFVEISHFSMSRFHIKRRGTFLVQWFSAET